MQTSQCVFLKGSKRMMKFRMAFGGASYGKYSTCISVEEYKELMKYASEKNVKLEEFKKFSGDIEIIKEAIDDIVLIARDFPKILKQRKSVVLRFDEHLSAKDFATTNKHLVSINGEIFNNSEYLQSEYSMLANKGFFVKGTTYRSIIRHEIGHVVANIYGLNSMDIAKEVLQTDNETDIYDFVMNNLSLYAVEYDKGIEFISECFSAYYSDVDNLFVKEYLNKCKELAKEVE